MCVHQEMKKKRKCAYWWKLASDPFVLLVFSIERHAPCVKKHSKNEKGLHITHVLISFFSSRPRFTMPWPLPRCPPSSSTPNAPGTPVAPWIGSDSVGRRV